MKKLICAVMTFALLMHCVVFSSFASAEENVLKIAVISESYAQNLTLEEAFFESNPNATIEYRLYTEEQFNVMMLTGKMGCDLVILPYNYALNLAEKGHLTPVDQALGLDGYPEQLLDVSQLLTTEAGIFGLPVHVWQTCWVWDISAGKKAGIDMPQNDWTWADYAACARNFPKDIDGDGKADVYLMRGGCLSAYPAFQNVNTGLFEQYVGAYDEFDTFAEKYLPLFREILVSDALLALDDTSGAAAVIQGKYSGNPIALIDADIERSDTFAVTMYIEGQEGYRFVTPPLLDAGNVAYKGNMSVCAMPKSAANKDLAKAFLRAMISDRALDYAFFGKDEFLVGKNPPKYAYIDDEGRFFPQFEAQGKANIYRVSAGRDIPVLSFAYSDEAYALAQDFREKLSIDTIPMSRDFYDAAWTYFQDWYLGSMSDEELTRNMQYLFALAKGVR